MSEDDGAQEAMNLLRQFGMTDEAQEVQSDSGELDDLRKEIIRFVEKKVCVFATEVAAKFFPDDKNGQLKAGPILAGLVGAGWLIKKKPNSLTYYVGTDKSEELVRQMESYGDLSGEEDLF